MYPTTKRKTRNHYQRALTRMEALEPRTLLSVTPVVTTYTPSNFTPAVGAYDADGNFWAVNMDTFTLDQMLVNGTNGNATTSIDLSPAAPYGALIINSIALGADGKFYMADGAGNDGAGGIDVVDLTTHVANQYLFTGSAHPEQLPLDVTVTSDGAVWFVGTDTGTPSNPNLIGRWTLASGAEFFTPAATDARAVAISANTDDTVWVGMQRKDGVSGALNHLLNVNASGTATEVAASATGVNFLTDVAADGDGGVWAALASPAGTTTASEEPDQVVHVDSGNVVTTIPVGSVLADHLNIHDLAVDGAGNLWMAELDGDTAFFITHNDTVVQNATYSGVALETAGLAASPVVAEASILTATHDLTPTYSIVNIVLTTSSEPPAFSGEAYTVNAQEDTNLNGTLLAMFTAAEGDYTATIQWGDTTSSVVTPLLTGQNGNEFTYSVLIPNKAYATQGDYTGSVQISDGSGDVGPALPFVAHISDIPLNITSLTATPLILRFTTLVATFTDDSGLALSTFTANINWGDSTTSRGIIVRDPSQPGRYLVLGLHRYRSSGTFTVQLTVTTNEAGASSTSSTLSTLVTVH